MRKMLLLFAALALVMSLGLGVAGCADEEQDQEDGLPSMVVIATTGLGSSAHGWSSVLGDAFTAETGVKVRLLPQSTDIARYTVLKDGDADLICASGVNGWAPTMGILEFEEWGPQPIYIVWQGSVLATGLAVRGDSDIYTGADLPGRTISNVPGMPSINLGRDHHLRTLGLTADDMVLVDFPSYPSVMEGLKLGTVEVIGAVSCTSSGMYDVASAPCGLRWIEMPHDNEEAWTAASKIAPYVPNVVTKAAGIDPETDEPKELAGILNNTYCYGTELVSEELAYQWAKTIHTRLEDYQDRHPSLPGFTLEQALSFKYSPYPYHPGTIKYFKEIGAWTDQHQEWQDRILTEMEERLAS